MHRRTFVRAAAGLSAGAVIAAGGPVRAQNGPRIRMAAVATENLAEPLYAQESGVFGRAGLNVDLQIFASGASANQAMAGGVLDVAVNDPLQLADAINRGVPYRYFAGSSVYIGDAPTAVLCVAKNGPIKTAKDLEGQAIAVPSVLDLASLSVREWMAQQGADPTKARFVELPGPAMAPAIVRGAIGAAMPAEPYITLSASETRVLENTYDTIANRFWLNGFYARRDWLAENGDVARRLAAALYDTARWANTHRVESLAILIKYSKLDPEKIRTIRRATYATSLDPASLKPVIEIGLKYKAIDKALAPSEMIAKL